MRRERKLRLGYWVGIDVQDVEDAVKYPAASLHIDRAVGDSGLAGERLIDVGAVRAEDRIGINERAEHVNDMRCVVSPGKSRPFDRCGRVPPERRSDRGWFLGSVRRRRVGEPVAASGAVP